jgi:hypothetical protein
LVFEGPGEVNRALVSRSSFRLNDLPVVRDITRDQRVHQQRHHEGTSSIYGADVECNSKTPKTKRDEPPVERQYRCFWKVQPQVKAVRRDEDRLHARDSSVGSPETVADYTHHEVWDRVRHVMILLRERMVHLEMKPDRRAYEPRQGEQKRSPHNVVGKRQLPALEAQADPAS